MRFLKLLSTALLLAWIAVAGSACARPDNAGGSPGVDAFLHTVYSRYSASGIPLDIDDVRAATIYEASLLALMRQDRQSLKGEAGVLDADPLCACQDHAVSAVNWVLQPAAGGGWSARVSLQNLGQAQHLELSLVHSGPGWRIADIQTENIPSLRASLQDEIQAAAAEAPQPGNR
ncbi:DUF3828 domain-containing protein [Rhodanobacter sp. AS-Z3]|uniref:DUF3828 domain-containing protein n=1 Tax=Rhodanobacter sp. AS-Z3 TaxID=3031330 RepID=UPI0024793A57|nr:DUF3828 domain-containing protein [Rhodanobacter sp. AS-Z3]WEN16128.1 DUF3828 domain-containing protein [Rhodanobacter sp. AS-Z3]